MNPVDYSFMSYGVEKETPLAFRHSSDIVSLTSYRGTQTHPSGWHLQEGKVLVV